MIALESWWVAEAVSRTPAAWPARLMAASGAGWRPRQWPPRRRVLAHVAKANPGLRRILRQRPGHREHQGLRAARRQYRTAGHNHAGLILVSAKTFPHNRSQPAAITAALAALLDKPSQIQAGQVVFLSRPCPPGNQPGGATQTEQSWSGPSRPAAAYRPSAVAGSLRCPPGLGCSDAGEGRRRAITNDRPPRTPATAELAAKIAGRVRPARSRDPAADRVPGWVRAADGSGNCICSATTCSAAPRSSVSWPWSKALASLSSRRYAGELEPAGQAVEARAASTSKSAVSRRFVAATDSRSSPSLRRSRPGSAGHTASSQGTDQAHQVSRSSSGYSRGDHLRDGVPR
jgi:hypothetical protein